MFKLLLSKIKESAISIIPIVVIVLLLALTPFYNMNIYEAITFIISSIILIVSMGIFNLGASVAMTTMGEYSGTALLKIGKLSIILFAAFMMGFLVTIAEPDLMVLAEQTKDAIPKTLLIVVVGLGVALFLLISVFKMLFHKSLSQMLMIFYMLLFALVAIMFEREKVAFMPLSFDSGGVTTGPMTVPFIMSFGLGIASTIGGKDRNENSFGMVALSSVGSVLAVLILTLFSKGNIEYNTEIYSIEKMFAEGTLFTNIFGYLFNSFLEVGRALILIFAFFMALNITVLKLPKTKMIQIIVGIFITLIGLVLFLTSANVGFLPIGQKIGIGFAEVDKRIVIAFAFIMGMTVVLAEPAIHVLNAQVEEVTGGAIKRSSMMIALSIGVGVAIALSIVRVIYGFSLLYYLVPGYFISLVLSLFVPPLFTAIAFDSGGVASGPMSSTFILPLVIGLTSTMLGDDSVLSLGFGTIALIAMTPLITIQLLGFNSMTKKYVAERSSMKRLRNTAQDNQVVYFEI